MKQVIYIGTYTGPNGGESWRLVLECGHTAWRNREASRPFQRFARGAPQRATCLSCAFGDPPVDVDHAIELAKRLDEASP